MKNRIGEAAGVVWHALEKGGPMSVTALSKRVKGVPADVVIMAVGWLAREDQVEFITERTGVKVAVRKPK